VWRGVPRGRGGGGGGGGGGAPPPPRRRFVRAGRGRGAL